MPEALEPRGTNNPDRPPPLLFEEADRHELLGQEAQFHGEGSVYYEVNMRVGAVLLLLDGLDDPVGGLLGRAGALCDPLSALLSVEVSRHGAGHLEENGLTCLREEVGVYPFLLAVWALVSVLRKWQLKLPGRYLTEYCRDSWHIALVRLGPSFCSVPERSVRMEGNGLVWSAEVLLVDTRWWPEVAVGVRAVDVGWDYFTVLLSEGNHATVEATPRAFARPRVGVARVAVFCAPVGSDGKQRWGS